MATAGGLTSRQFGEAIGEPAGTVRYRLGQAHKQHDRPAPAALA
jgi:hypothetical protein